MVRTECEYCGNEYLAERNSSKYCSNSCRTMAYRKRKVQTELIQDALQQKILIKQAIEKYLADFRESLRVEKK